MQTATVYEGFARARNTYFTWRRSLAFVYKLALALGMAVITGLMAQIRLPLPWTPVPITGQTLAVLLAGIMLGKWWGGVSQALYVSLGVAGIPWFNGGGAGLAFLAGPTGGYLIGFILAALVIGHVFDTNAASGRFLPMAGLMFTADMVLIYLPGLLQLAFWLRFVKGTGVTLWQLLGLGLLPFLLGDVIKALAAAGIARAMAPDSSRRAG